MDTRPRVVVVEDDDNMRETWIDVLGREKFRVDGAASADVAITMIDRCSYHVALIDIMLAGNDSSNREGITVLKHLQELGEGTRAIILSGQKDDMTLVRDVLKKHDALDYVEKRNVKDNAFLVQKVRDALGGARIPAKALDWEGLMRMLAYGLSESVFVSDCLSVLQFRGGFENLSHSLLTACKHFVPLLVELGASRAISREKVPDVFSGRFWSKGQGVPIEILIYGKNAPAEMLDKEWNLSGRVPLYNETKSGLSIVILESPELNRERFGPVQG